ncbi:thiamine phosphate synthase [Ruminococcus sp. HUN007]|uniref:thiamine phosphate synthase n=1 Tax=Ruminococcus sp. HUN007 TaxID=1514668 RepID=UPI0005D19C55|nr:thiamine phosphate synthase [Ruminococcus sp. HUN007]
MRICVTNRLLCRGDFYETVRKACETAGMVILREKDLTETEYTELARKIKEICAETGTDFCINKYAGAARAVGCDALQLSYSDFPALPEKFCRTGVSVHSVKEAVTAAEKGADFLIAGHIFATDCKKGVPPRGLRFLTEIISNVEIPVYAIGGINEENEHSVLECGAAGVCIMSGYMNFQNSLDRSVYV